jgi:116 kDa U5 small nuclear ribonucleoprotein component N-terminus
MEIASYNDQSTSLSVAAHHEREASNKIVLHEDKKYYPNPDEVYPGEETCLCKY